MCKALFVHTGHCAPSGSCSQGAVFVQQGDGFWPCSRLISCPCKGCWVLADPSASLSVLNAGKSLPTSTLVCLGADHLSDCKMAAIPDLNGPLLLALPTPCQLPSWGLLGVGGSLGCLEWSPCTKKTLPALIPCSAAAHLPQSQ